jgi:hypothetical protein
MTFLASFYLNGQFEKPGSRDCDYIDLVKESVGEALADAGIKYSDVQHAFVGYVYGNRQPSVKNRKKKSLEKP